MNNFTFYAPTMFAFGQGEASRVGALVRQFGGSKVLLVAGGGSVKKNGAYDAVAVSLKEAGLPWCELWGVQANPRSGKVYEGIELARTEGADFLLAIGGGSVIDTAKAIGMGIPYDGDFWDFHMGGVVPEDSLTLGCVLTLAAAGSEGSNSCVINKVVNGVVKKKGCNCQCNVPDFAIMNPEFTKTLPAYQTACGACDIMCHVMERYFTNTKDVELTDGLCEGVLRTMVAMIPRVMKDPEDYEARANIMWASTMAHNNICGVDREQDWGSHRIEQELSAFYDCAHGAGLAVVMPAWMECVMDHDIMRFAQFANRVFGISVDFAHPERTAKAGIAALRALWKSADLPLNFKELGAKREDIPVLVDHLVTDDKTEGHFVVMDGPFITKVLEHAADYRS